MPRWSSLSPCWDRLGCSWAARPIRVRSPGDSHRSRLDRRGPTERPPLSDLETVPAWALADTTRTHEREIGIGSGDTLDRATRLALQDVASRLSVSVEAQLRDVLREASGFTVESLEQIIETRVTGARFPSWERTRTARARRQALDDLRSRLSTSYVLDGLFSP